MPNSDSDQVQYSDTEYRDESVLRELYEERNMTIYEIGNLFNVSGSTISTWLKKNGIPSSDRRHNPDAEYNDPDILKELYQNEGLSTHDIAEEFGVSSGAIHHALVSMGIDTRSRSEANSEGPGVAYHTQKESGYPAVSARGSDRTVQVRVHQLVAIADGVDPQDVFSNGSYHVHHKNGCAFNNRPSNLEILTAEEHAALTHKSR